MLGGLENLYTFGSRLAKETEQLINLPAMAFLLLHWCTAACHHNWKRTSSIPFPSPGNPFLWFPLHACRFNHPCIWLEIPPVQIFWLCRLPSPYYWSSFQSLLPSLIFLWKICSEKKERNLQICAILPFCCPAVCGICGKKKKKLRKLVD